MKKDMNYTKIVKDAFNGNVINVQERINKIMTDKVNVLLNKKQDKMFSKIFQ